MKDQPWDLKQTWPVGRSASIYKCHQKFWGPFIRIWVAKTSNFDHFLATSALDTVFLRNETSHQQTKCYCQSTMCPLKVEILSVTFDPETAEIRLLILTGPIKIQNFKLLPGFPHKGH